MTIKDDLNKDISKLITYAKDHHVNSYFLVSESDVPGQYFCVFNLKDGFSQSATFVTILETELLLFKTKLLRSLATEQAVDLNTAEGPTSIN